MSTLEAMLLEWREILLSTKPDLKNLKKPETENKFEVFEDGFGGERKKNVHEQAQAVPCQAGDTQLHEADRQECLLEWLETLTPAPRHRCRELVPEEEKHLRAFIKAKLTVPPRARAGDAMLHISGSDLWRLQGEYERATGFEFSMRIDYFDWYVAQATGARVMDAADGQRWLLGVECAGRDRFKTRPKPGTSLSSLSGAGIKNFA